MEISVRGLIELIVIVLILKLIVSRWQPPIQESIQALFCIVIGTTVGVILNPTQEGVVTAVIGSGIAFYGADLFNEFRTVKDELKVSLDNNDLRIDKKKE